MGYKVFDFQCPLCTTDLTDVTIDLEKEPPPTCPSCGCLMKKVVGTIWKKHVSWSKWNAIG